MEHALYIVTAEITGDESSLLRAETSSERGHVHAFVSAQDALEAGIKVQLALEKDSYEVLRIEEIINALFFEFEKDVEEENVELMTEALETGEVVFGAFYAPEDEREGKSARNRH